MFSRVSGVVTVSTSIFPSTIRFEVSFSHLLGFVSNIVAVSSFGHVETVELSHADGYVFGYDSSLEVNVSHILRQRGSGGPDTQFNDVGC